MKIKNTLWSSALIASLVFAERVAPPEVDVIIGGSVPEYSKEGLVLDLPFDLTYFNKLNDLASNLDVTLHGGKFVSDRFNSVESALSFDGDTFIEVDTFSNGVDVFDFQDGFSFDFWVKADLQFPDANPFSTEEFVPRNNFVFGRGVGDANIFAYPYTLFLKQNSFRMNSSLLGLIYNSVGNLQNIEWSNIVLTFDLKNSNYHFYINGVLLRTSDIQNYGKFNYDNTKFFIGKSGESEGFVGLLDSFKVYNRVLNESELHRASEEFYLPDLPTNSLYNQVSDLENEIVELSNIIAELELKLADEKKKSLTTFVNGWIYDPNKGWIYTDNEHYPLVYVYETSTWHYYELGSANPRYFYSYGRKQWYSWD